MKFEINEDWLATIIAFVMIILILIGLLPLLPWPIFGVLK